MNKKTTVLGGGHGAHTMAADFSLRGFEVTLFETPEFKHNIKKLFQERTIISNNRIKGCAVLSNVTDDIEEAIEDVKYIHIVTPAFAHGNYINILKGKVKKEQVIILYPGNFSALVFKEQFGESCPIICETNTLPYDTRLSEPCIVNVYGLNKVNIAILPSSKSGDIIDELNEFHKFEKVYKDVLEASLSSLNPVLHSGPCVINVGPIEYRARGDFYMYEHGFTPSAARLDIALDNERKKVGEKLGYDIRTLEDFCELETNFTWQQLYKAVHGNISLTPICGPNDINNRYLTEDAQFGLVTWSSIGKELGVETPVTDSIINIYNIVHQTNWREKGRTIKDLGISGKSPKEILEYLK